MADLTWTRRRVLATGSSLLAGCAVKKAPGDASADLERLAEAGEDLVAPAIAAEGIPGAAFVVFDAQGRTAQRYFDHADREQAKPVDAATLWPIASVTKVLTTIAALALVEDGRLALDADIRKTLRRVQIPDFEGPAPTLRHLLSHTGGFDEVPGRLWSDDGAMPALADFLNAKLVRIRPAGELTAYSSYGIALASAMMEEATGLAYEAFAERAVFRPLGMQASRFMRKRSDEAGVAAAYAIEDGRASRIPHELYVTSATSSAVCTLDDVARFGAMLLGGAGSALSQATRNEMLRQQATVHPKIPGWGLGVQRDRFGALELVEHGGDIGGFSCLLTLVPEKAIGVFTVHHGEGGDLRFRVRDEMLNVLAPQGFAPPSSPAGAIDLSDFAGKYRSTLECMSCGDSGDPFEATAGDHSLALWGRNWIAAGADYFLRDDGMRAIGFARNGAGAVRAVSGGSWRVAVKV